MMADIMPAGPIAYAGQVAIPFVNKTFAPTNANNQFPTPTIWCDTAHNVAYIFMGAANGWFTIGVSPGSIITQNAFLVGGAGNTIVSTAAATNGQIPIGSTGSAPVAATITAGTGVQVTNGPGTITISSTNSGIAWTVITAASTNLASNSGFITNRGTLVTLTLPTSSSVGDLIYVSGLGAGGWQIAQNAGQLIHFGSAVTTTGAGGSLASTNQFDTISIVCIVANTTWSAIYSIGNITVV